MAKNRMQIMASLREKSLLVASVMFMSRNSTTKAVEIRRSSGSSLAMVFFLMRIGLINAAMPISSNMLIILLPMTLPISISVLPAAREEMETASSGAPVPTATIVRPMSCLETLKFDATDEAPEISQSAPLIRRANPIISINICKKISMLMVIIP